MTDTFLPRDLVSKIKRDVKWEAEQARENAGYSGAMDDGGASFLLSQLNAWLDGLNQRVPDVFKHIEVKYRRERDSEYGEYKRLKQKFEVDMPLEVKND